MDINFSIGRVILLTYIILASGYCSSLFSKGLKQAIEDNRMVQHLLLLILIIALMTIIGNPLGVEPTENQQLNIIISSLIIYVWFILTTKLDLSWNVGILILLTIFFLYESKKSSEYKLMLKDYNLTKEKKKELLEYYASLQKYMLTAIFGVTLVGTLFFADQKAVQHGGGFSYFNFFFY
jgi:predicted PurR-regulated permease PerM